MSTTLYVPIYQVHFFNTSPCRLCLKNINTTWGTRERNEETIRKKRSKSTCLQKEICSCKKLTCSLNRLLLIWWWKQMIIFQYKWFFRSSTLESSELLFEMISSHKQQVSDPFCPTLRTPVVQMCKSLPSCDPSLGEFLGDLPGSTLLF